MKLNALWAGGDLTYIEQLCLSSAVAMGHSVDLYAYEPISNAPSGVSLRDAREVMPEHQMLKYERQDSFALGADLFRILIQKQNKGCYIDCDMLLMKPIPEEDYIFGLEIPKSINNAILKLPADSPMLEDLLKLISATPIIAPWWGTFTKAKQRLRWLAGHDRNLSKLRWGTTGPMAVTYFAKRHGLFDRAKPIDTFYPNSFIQAEDIFAPAEIVNSRCTENTLAVHLWHSKIKLCANLLPLPGSFLAEQCIKFGVHDPRWGRLKYVA